MQRDEHPVLHAGGGHPVTVKPGAYPVPIRRVPSHRGEQRHREQLENDRGGQWIAGQADDGSDLGAARSGRGPFDVAEQRRVTGADRDAGHRDAADLGEHRRRVVTAAPARSGDDEHQVGRGRYLP